MRQLTIPLALVADARTVCQCDRCDVERWEYELRHGPRLLIGCAGLYRNAWDLWLCADCWTLLWGRKMTIKTRADARERKATQLWMVA